MPALDAFHMKADAFRVMHTGEWARFVDGFTSSLRGEQPGVLGASGFNEQADEFSRDLSTTLSLAETFYIAPQMNALVSAAAESWPEDETVAEEDFPVDHGWLFIPGGITAIDVRGSMYTTSALTWRRRGNAFRVVLWANKHDDPPHMKADPAWGRMPTMTPWHLTEVTIGETLPIAIRMGKVLPPEVSAKMQWSTSANGTVSLSFPQGWTHEEMVPHRGPDPIIAWLVTTLRIMQQPLASVERKGLPAAMRKNLMRHPRRVKNTAITVIDFRRRASDFEPGSGREYSHRFLRRGHWRRQPYKRDDGTWDRRRIWVHATIVGDPSKPLMLRNHVNSFTR